MFQNFKWHYTEHKKTYQFYLMEDSLANHYVNIAAVLLQKKCL